MNALPVPPPAYHCVASGSAEAANVNGHLTVSGVPDQVAAFLSELAVREGWTIEADATDRNIRFVRLKRNGDLEFRHIGGAIFDSQRRHLAVSFDIEPPICSDEDQ